VFERTLPPEMTDLHTYSNVIAAKDGEVLSADILAGVPYISAGDTVQKGDLLAGGIQELSDGTERLLRAKAIVMARTRTSFSCQTALNVSVQKPESMSDKRSLYFFGLVFPPQNEKASSAVYLSTPTSIFPIGLIRTRTTGMTDISLKLTDAQAKLICMTDLAFTAFQSIGDTYVYQREISSQTAAQYSVDAVFYCEEDIAMEQMFGTAR